MEVREAAWAKRWQRDTADSESIVAELVSLRASATTEDVPLLEPVTVDKLDQTLRRVLDNTGLGSACVEPGAIKHALVLAQNMNGATSCTVSSETECFRGGLESSS